MEVNGKVSKPFAFRFFVALASARGVVTFWLLFGLIHALFRFSYSGSLSLDDSAASELVQTFALGYQARQPPLYEWLLWSTQQLIGTGIQSFLLVRYALIAALGYSIFVATRHAVRDERIAALASLSIAINYQIGWTFHESGTQTILLSIAFFCTFDAVMRFLARASLSHALWLGTTVGFGFLSKHSYPLFLVSLALGALTLPELRSKLRDRLLIVSAVVAFVLVSPYLIWLAQVGGDVVAASRATLIDEPLDYLTRTSHGLSRLIRSILVFWLPWIVLIAMVAPPAFWRAPASAMPPTTAERLAWRTIAIAVALALIGTIAIGATNLGERYMYPLLLIAPIYVFARIDRLAVTDLRIAKLGTLFVSCAIIVFVVRVASVLDNRITRTDPYGTLAPYDRVAAELKARGLAEGTAFTPNVRIAGNLRAALPGLRVITTDSYRLECPPRRPVDDRIAFVITPLEAEDPRITTMVRLEGQPREEIVILGRRTIHGPLVPWTWYLVRLDAQAIACARCGPQAARPSVCSGRG